MSRWYEDIPHKNDPEAPWNREYPRAFNKRKKTGKWCRGKVGVEHHYELVEKIECFWQVRENAYIGKYPNWTRGTRAIWRCGCQMRCTGCNKRSWQYGDTKCLHESKQYRTRPRADEYERWRWW